MLSARLVEARPPGGGLPGRGPAFDVKSGGKTTRAHGPWTQGNTAAVLCVAPGINQTCVQRARYLGGDRSSAAALGWHASITLQNLRAAALDVPRKFRTGFPRFASALCPTDGAPSRRAPRTPPRPPQYFGGMAPTAARRAKPVQRTCSQGLRGNPRCVPPEARRRRPKLRIVRFRVGPKAHSLRWASSPHRTRCAGLRRGPQLPQAPMHARFLPANYGPPPP